MYLLYLDESGSAGNTGDTHFILGGVALFERQTHWLDVQLDELASELRPEAPQALEFHGSPMLGGRGWWRRLPKLERRRAIRKTLEATQALRGPWTLFGVAIEKAALRRENLVEYAFEQVSSRFDHFLSRRKKPERGLILLDRSSGEKRLQELAHDFTNFGHRWGTTRNLADVPYFADSRASRLIQYADLVSFALWRRFEHEDTEFFDVIANHFDTHAGVVHGLHHYKRGGRVCGCPGCASRTTTAQGQDLGRPNQEQARTVRAAVR